MLLKSYEVKKFINLGSFLCFLQKKSTDTGSIQCWRMLKNLIVIYFNVWHQNYSASSFLGQLKPCQGKDVARGQKGFGREDNSDQETFNGDDFISASSPSW
jgi:hypothetical protein